MPRISLAHVRKKSARVQSLLQTNETPYETHMALTDDGRTREISYIVKNYSKKLKTTSYQQNVT